MLAVLPGRRAAAARKRFAEKNMIAETFVIDDRTGRPFQADTFRHRFAEVRAKAFAAAADERSGRAPDGSGSARPAGQESPRGETAKQKWFSDTRDTAVTRLALSGGYDAARISAVSGHSIKSIHEIMKHYLVLNQTFADKAMDSLIAWMKKEGIAV